MQCVHAWRAQRTNPVTAVSHWWHTAQIRPSYKSGRGLKISFCRNPRYVILVPVLVLIFSKVLFRKVHFPALARKSFPLRLLGSLFYEK